jgi:hypothetical protein
MTRGWRMRKLITLLMGRPRVCRKGGTSAVLPQPRTSPDLIEVWAGLNRWTMRREEFETAARRQAFAPGTLIRQPYEEEYREL